MVFKCFTCHSLRECLTGSSLSLSVKDGLLYNVVNDSDDDLLCNAVRADVFMPGGVHHVMQSARSIDGGKARSCRSANFLKQPMAL